MPQAAGSHETWFRDGDRNRTYKFDALKLKKKTLLQPQRYSVLFNVDCLVIFKDTVQNVDINKQI